MECGVNKVTIDIEEAWSIIYHNEKLP